MRKCFFKGTGQREKEEEMGVFEMQHIENRKSQIGAKKRENSTQTDRKRDIEIERKKERKRKSVNVNGKEWIGEKINLI